MKLLYLIMFLFFLNTFVMDFYNLNVYNKCLCFEDKGGKEKSISGHKFISD